MFNKFVVSVLLAMLTSGCASHPEWITQNAGPDRGCACASKRLGGHEAAYIKASAQLLHATRLSNHAQLDNDRYDEVTIQTQDGPLIPRSVIQQWHGRINGVKIWCVLVGLDHGGQ
jgi:hypothetical protein